MSLGQYDERIEKAVHILWVNSQFERAQEAKALLEEAVADGVADGYYFLARIYAGSCFVDTGFGFPEDDDKVDEYLDLSIEKGSAIGMFGARRFGGYKPRCGSFLHEPYHSSVEIWNEVCNIAAAGEIFTQYLVANAYYYGDVAELMQVDFKNMTDAQIRAQFRQWTETAIPMYEDLISKGLVLGAGNYINILTSGDWGVPKNERRAAEIERIAAEKGHTFFMVRVGENMLNSNPLGAAEMFEKAAKKNYMPAYAYLGKMYTYDGKMPKDIKKARDYIELCYQSGEEQTLCHNRLGEIYFYGGDGVEIDYDKAFMHLKAAHDDENYWGSDMLGTCYLKGLGTQVDYARAKEELERYPGEALSAVGLGEIYAYGLGGPVDIKKAMTYWNKFPKHEHVIANKKNFKKTLFGWKRIEQ